MKKIIFMFLFLSLLAITGCSSQQTTEDTIIPGADDNSDAITGDVKEFSLIAKKWEFVPSRIQVNKGDRIILNIQSADVAHGFALTEFNINERIESGKITKIEFVADREGTFSFFCSVFCGDGHSTMKGQLIVT